MTSTARPPAERSRWWLLAAVGYAAGIFTASSLSSRQLPAGSLWSFDKVIHFAVYGGLGALLALAFGGRSATRGALIALGLGIVFGASDEWHQSFVPGRDASAADWLADALGTGVGVLVIVLYSSWKAKTAKGSS